MKLRAVITAAALWLLGAGVANATCSTVNPNIPGQGSQLTSAPVRQNFAAAFADVNNVLGMFAGLSAPAAPCTGQFWRDTSTNPNRIKQWDGAAWALWGLLDTTGHTFSAALASGTVIASPPITAGFSSGVVTIGLNIDSNFAVVANTLSISSFAVGNIMANATASPAEPVSTTPDAWFKRWCSSSNDQFPYITGGAWGCLGMFGTAHTWTAQQTFAGITVTNLNGVIYPASGTSGGVDYWFSNTEVRSSGALTQNGFVLGGGPGGAPTSTAAPTTAQIAIGQASGAPLLAALSGDVVNNAAGATTIQPNVVSFSKMVQLTALSVLGNCTNTTANMAGVTGVANQVLRVNGAGTACAFGAIDLSQAAAATGVLQTTSMPALTGDVTNTAGTVVTVISNSAVTNAKLANMAAATVKANATGGSAAPTDVGAAVARSASVLNIDQLTTHGDSIYTILPTDRVVGTSAAFTASRAWTMPAANAVNAGQRIVIADYAGGVTGTNTLVITRAGADTINGGTTVTISTANGAYECFSDGASKWSCQSMGAASGGGVTSVTCGTGLSGGTITTSGTCAVSNLSTNSQLIFSQGTGATITAGTTNEIGVSYVCASSNEALCFVPISVAGTIKNMRVNVANAAGAGQSYTLTFRKNAADQAVTCAISGASATTCTDLANSFSVAAGDNVGVKFVSSGSAASNQVTIISVQLVTQSP